MVGERVVGSSVGAVSVEAGGGVGSGVGLGGGAGSGGAGSGGAGSGGLGADESGSGRGAAPVRIVVPGSKSVTHRAFLLGALSAVPCRVEGALLGADCLSTLGVLRGLGARFVVEGGVVCFEPASLGPGSGAVLDCGNSGTTLRLMAGQVARFEGGVTLSGDASLQSRPNGALVEALRALGASVESVGGRAPLTVCGPVRAGVVELPARTSSQFASSLMLALAQVEGESVVRLAGPVASRPYLAVTAEVAGAFGLRFDFVDEIDGGLSIGVPGGQRVGASGYVVEGDWSGAAFMLVAGALLGRSVALVGLRGDAVQGDRVIAELVGRFGARVGWQGGALVLEPGELVGGGGIDVGGTPDLFPPLCALAAGSVGRTVLYGAPGLRDKECDRIAAMAEGLGRLGVVCRERRDGIEIVGGGIGGGGIGGGVVHAFEDHRVHMAFSVLARVARGRVEVDGRGCEGVSYPMFHRDLERVAGVGG